MTKEPTDEKESHSEYPEMDFRIAAFPSDALSVKRLRAVFPKQFDDGTYRDGYESNFFFASYEKQPEHLMWLTHLLGDERLLAAGEFHRQFVGQYPDVLNKTELALLDVAEQNLARHYQYFKLADSPETARFLVEQVKAEGERQARARLSRSK